MINNKWNFKNNSILSNSVFALVTQLIIFLILFAKVKVFTNVLSIEDYGYSTIFLSAISITYLLSSLQLSEFMIREGIQDNTFRVKIFQVLLFIFIILSIPITILTYFILELNHAFNILLFLLSSVSYGITQIVRMYIFSCNRLKKYYIFTMVMNVLWLLLFFGIVIVFRQLKMNLDYTLICFILGNIFSLILVLKYLRADNVFRIKLTKVEIWDIAKKGIKYSGWLIIYYLGINILFLIDRIVILHYLDDKNLGYYSSLFILSNISIPLFGVIIESLKNQIYTEVNYKFINQLYTVLLPIFLSILIFVLNNGNVILALLTKKEYTIYSDLLIFPTIFSFFYALSSISIVFLQKEYQTKYIGIIFIVTILSNFIINIILVPLLGIKGAIYANLACGVLLYVLLTLKYFKYLEYKNIILLFISFILLYYSMNNLNIHNIFLSAFILLITSMTGIIFLRRETILSS